MLVPVERFHILFPLQVLKLVEFDTCNHFVFFVYFHVELVNEGRLADYSSQRVY